MFIDKQVHLKESWVKLVKLSLSGVFLLKHHKQFSSNIVYKYSNITLPLSQETYIYIYIYIYIYKVEKLFANLKIEFLTRMFQKTTSPFSGRKRKTYDSFR